MKDKPMGKLSHLIAAALLAAPAVSASPVNVTLSASPVNVTLDELGRPLLPAELAQVVETSLKTTPSVGKTSGINIAGCANINCSQL